MPCSQTRHSTVGYQQTRTMSSSSGLDRASVRANDVTADTEPAFKVETKTEAREMNTDDDSQSSEVEYPKGLQLTFIAIALALALFLIALDMVSFLHFLSNQQQLTLSRQSLQPLFPKSQMNSRVLTKSDGTLLPSSSPSDRSNPAGARSTNTFHSRYPSLQLSSFLRLVLPSAVLLPTRMLSSSDAPLLASVALVLVPVATPSSPTRLRLNDDPCYSACWAFLTVSPMSSVLLSAVFSPIRFLGDGASTSICLLAPYPSLSLHSSSVTHLRRNQLESP